eukprot:scpid66266/ scgid0242/ 
MANNADSPPRARCLVLYSHVPDFRHPEATEQRRLQRRRVRALSKFFAEHGVQCVLDQYAEDDPPSNWNEWLEHEMRTCHCLLLVMSPAFRQAYDQQQIDDTLLRRFDQEPDVRTNQDLLRMASRLIHAKLLDEMCTTTSPSSSSAATTDIDSQAHSQMSTTAGHGAHESRPRRCFKRSLVHPLFFNRVDTECLPQLLQWRKQFCIPDQLSLEREGDVRNLYAAVLGVPLPECTKPKLRPGTLDFDSFMSQDSSITDAPTSERHGGDFIAGSGGRGHSHAVHIEGNVQLRAQGGGNQCRRCCAARVQNSRFQFAQAASHHGCAAASAEDDDAGAAVSDWSSNDSGDSFDSFSSVDSSSSGSTSSSNSGSRGAGDDDGHDSVFDSGYSHQRQHSRECQAEDDRHTQACQVEDGDFSNASLTWPRPSSDTCTSLGDSVPDRGTPLGYTACNEHFILSDNSRKVNVDPASNSHITNASTKSSHTVTVPISNDQHAQLLHVHQNGHREPRTKSPASARLASSQQACARRTTAQQSVHNHLDPRQQCASKPSAKTAGSPERNGNSLPPTKPPQSKYYTRDFPVS